MRVYLERYLALCLRAVIPTLGWKRQKDQELKADLSYLDRVKDQHNLDKSHKTKKQTKASKTKTNQTRKLKTQHQAQCKEVKQMILIYWCPHKLCLYKAIWMERVNILVFYQKRNLWK